jgi:hypothetical protein
MASTRKPTAAPPQFASYIDPDSPRSQPTDLHLAFVAWLQEKTGVDPGGFDDVTTAFTEGVRLGTVLRMTYQKSPENQARKGSAAEERAQAREERKALAVQKKADAAAKREAAAAAKAAVPAPEKAAAKASKAPAKKAAPAKKTAANKAKADAPAEATVTDIGEAKGAPRRPARRRAPAKTATSTGPDF